MVPGGFSAGQGLRASLVVPALACDTSLLCPGQEGAASFEPWWTVFCSGLLVI